MRNSHPKDNSDDASAVTGLSSDNSNPSSLLFFDEDEEVAIKLKKKSVPKHDNGMGESYVALWVKESKEITSQDTLHTALVKAVTIIHFVDGEASFQCVYDDNNARWLDADTNEMTPVTPMRGPKTFPWHQECRKSTLRFNLKE